MEPITCVILIIVVIAIAALGEEISARKSNKTYSQNTNFNETERVCNVIKQIYEISSEILCSNSGNGNRHRTDSLIHYFGNINL